MTIIFPSEPFTGNKQVDSSFEAEKNAALLAGFNVYFFDHDEFVKDGSFNPVLKTHSEYEPTILRSWMLKSEQYEDLFNKFMERGYRLINTPEEYVNAHHFPKSYSKFKDYTSKAWWTDEINGLEDLSDINWNSVRDYLGGDVIIKDYVKSAKSDPELFILGRELDNNTFQDRVVRFIERRGKLFNKGLVFKQVEKLKKYGDNTNEWRFFVFNGIGFTFEYNGNGEVNKTMPSFESIINAQRISQELKSNFVTIDLAEKEDGDWMILEVGDGQVSGLPSTSNPLVFYNNLKNRIDGK